MSLDTLLQKTKNQLNIILEKNPIPQFSDEYPKYILFFAISDSIQRAHVEIATGDTFEEAWEKGVTALKKWKLKSWHKPAWLRVEIVREIESLSWKDLKLKMSKFMRNYFRFGISLTPDFKNAILEYELGANAILYKTDSEVCTPNEGNLKAFSKHRFHKELQWPTDDNVLTYRFRTLAAFSDGKNVYEIESFDRKKGYRVIENWGLDTVTEIIETSSQYLEEQIKSDGSYRYGFFPCFDRPIPTYNALRHASSTYALLEAWEIMQLESQKKAIDKALKYLTSEFIRTIQLDDGSSVAFLVDLENEIKIGGNAVSILAYAKYTELTGDQKYLDLMEKLALGILFMQKSDTGEYIHVLNYPDLSVKEVNRTIYYDGEAAFGLMRLYGITKDPRWLKSVEKAFDYFIENKHWQANDHWQSYCVNELTLYNPDPKYFKFGLDNIRDHLDYVVNRITTRPTLLELMMAAEKMIVRIQNDPNASYLLDGFDIDQFYKALEYRARFLLNGFFYPEVAMFFKNPKRILGSFFMRYDAFRVRIDDVEHYLSGLIAYQKYLCLGQKAIQIKKQPPIPLLTSEMLARVTSGDWIKNLNSENPIISGISVVKSMHHSDYLLVARGKYSQRYLIESDIKELVLEKGAAGIICEDAKPYLSLDVPILEVSNVERAILALGRAARILYPGRVIGVTGSAGKTTTVSLIAHVLGSFGEVGYSKKSANLPMGIAWNLINMPINAKQWIVEMAIGQMALSAEIVKPDIAVVTNIAPAHLTHSNNTEAIARKKSAILNEMTTSGQLILFGEAKHKEIFLEKAQAMSISVITFGAGNENDLQLLNYSPFSLSIRVYNEIIELPLQLPNQYLALNILAVISVVIALDLDWKEFLGSFATFAIPEGRGKVINITRQQKNFVFYDDSYNANPLSMASAISTLKNIENNKSKFLILGDMKELGKNEELYHRELIDHIIDVAPDKIILCGELMRFLWEDLQNSPQFSTVKMMWKLSVDDILIEIDDWIESDDFVVVKASNSMMLNKIVEKYTN